MWGIAIFVFAGTALFFEHSNAQLPCNIRPPNFPPDLTLNMTQLNLKRWYVQGKYFARAADVVEPTNQCYMVYTSGYNAPHNFFFNENYVTETGGFRHREGRGFIIEEGDEAYWSFSRGLFPDYGIVFAFTDYENYGVMHWCPEREGSPNMEEEHVLILTGVPQPDETVLASMKEQVASLRFSTEFLASYEHPSDCKYE